MAHDPRNKQQPPSDDRNSETESPRREIYDGINDSQYDRDHYVAPRDSYTPDPPDDDQ